MSGQHRDENGPRIVVSVGTDVHPFDRLVQWSEALAERNPGVAIMLQHGASREPGTGLASVQATDRETLLRWYDGADVVVTQGGPGSILDARAVGVIPLVVPRDPALGEHVDGHQLAFTPLMEGDGHAVVVRDLETLALLVAERLAHPELARSEPREADPAPATHALAKLVDQARVTPRRRGMLLRRVKTLLAPSRRTTQPTTGGTS